MEQSKHDEAQRKLKLIEERLKIMEGSDVYSLVNANKMSLVPDLVLLPKFKVPTFDKYDGTKCPSTHVLSEDDGPYEQWQVANLLFPRQFDGVCN